MSAVFVIGGQQYSAKEGDVLYVNTLGAKEGELVRFDRVLMANNKIGKPTIAGASVTCQVLKHGRQKKIHIIKFISQKHHMKRQGHRQGYTKLVVKEIKA
ncbi:large subunit ribosomal protein L21 [Mycoplasmoides fastidiosum]|uniref:Large ribosomal subunit protein bL21 n=1 Tax=Mycoplasmoides fastidiosum TaxID=92758 RepID=A0ABU0LZQ6_9BACT|nr:50S ribosomal protein L21 [Mycoplasmoides fastidiosum]MDQ0514078.1 large subunit ribosomal protein L21 [Mycoplasmoides fastidiosum]UUD37512.1 50S ribosomal protein L21 [Mycoplasmoides fastidiosum]